MKYKMTDEKWDSVMAFLNKVLENPDRYPDKGVILSLSDEEMTKVFTRKRLELVRLIQNKKPVNATGLSGLAGRRLSAVMRDLELLENYGIVGLEKKGKNVRPIVTAELLVLPLVKFRPKKLGEIRATA